MSYAGRNDGWREDERIDCRIRDFFKKYPFDINTKPEMVELLNSDEIGGGEALSSSHGLEITTETITSSPDNNRIKVSVINPLRNENMKVIPCVVYIHGGGMSKYSCFYNNFQTLGRLIAHQGMVVVLPSFRNCQIPSEDGADISKFPGGLNDCISTVKWVYNHSDELKIDKNRIIIAGESGGGNLTIATALKLIQQKEINMIYGIYSICPYLGGIYPNSKYPSTVDNAGIFLDYVINLDKPFYVTKYQSDGENLFADKNIYAWPAFCSKDDLLEFPKTIIVVNEFDPLRDEGIDFYKKLQESSIPSKLQIIPGTIHGIGSYLVNICPDISKQQAQQIRDFCYNNINELQ